MTERPILFSAPMVLALLSGQKTQTRRVIKRLERFEGGIENCVHCCPYGVPGDRLWVRETWAAGKCADGLAPSMLHPGTWKADNGGLWYPADGAEPAHPISPRGKTRVSIHMPRWASRITLEITGVRVERLQAISARDAIAEGIPAGGPENPDGIEVREFRALWESLYGAASWDENPWMWAVDFKYLEAEARDHG